MSGQREDMGASAAVGLFVGISAAIYFANPTPKRSKESEPQPGPEPEPPVSVNYFFTRTCNYECGFCFHTAKTSYIEPLESTKRGLALLRDAGMKKINFAGGEPFLYPKHLGALVEYCKKDLKIESVSIVTNGSRVTERFLSKYGQYIDIIAVSCDSFQEDVNVKIGRGKGSHLQDVLRASKLCRDHGIRFKLNTVVNQYNYTEDMNEHIAALDPFRWKVFQVLIIEEENGSEQTLRDGRRFTITDEQFQQFCKTHEHNKCFIPESNDVMKSSYLLMDEYMRFLNKGVGEPSRSILDVGVKEALRHVYWDTDNFHQRGGIYDWSRESASCSTTDPKLTW
ncbi:hypothetical protein PRK78_006909 [Emydomyces testavorans]|uniref:Radical SAM core domain-containing protein n=1 Tax=Emydomyces testavorans TaxID=2070801 RepID=A0AAF0DMB4_9EURO|nr:hypothetical protein PRK78_006909 [Emydomyces testavorans]